MEAGQEAGSSSKIPSITSVGRGWKSGHPPPPSPRTSCPAGSGGAGSVEGSERVRRAETPLRRIGGAGGERRNSGHLKGAPGARRAFVRRYRGDALGGERRGRVCLVRGILFGDPEFLSGLGGRGCSRRGVFWEVAWPPVGLLFKNWQREKKKKNWQRKAGGPRLGIRVGLRGEGPGQAGYGVQETRGVSMFVDFSRRPPGAG